MGVYPVDPMTDQQLEDDIDTCPTCKEDIRQYHCLGTPNAEFREEKRADGDTCALCNDYAIGNLRMRWNCRARPKYRNRQMANPLHSVDHWMWLDMAACAACATAAVKVDEFAVGWEYWDALDSVCVRVEAYKQSRRFTVLYCRNHDQGALVEGVHDALPDSVNPCGVESATDCEYGAPKGRSR